jgi:HK97 family phage prohead protease
MTETTMTTTDQPAGQLRYRTIETFEVDYPNRTIELIVTPYEQEAIVPFDGRLVTEVFSAGAYAGIERRANRIRVNRDHDVKRTVGRAVALHPSRDVGLVAEIRIAKTDLGDETLALADEGILDASAGYLPMANGEIWETRNRVRIVKAWLGHIAMTPDPAYQNANVLAVRHNDVGQVDATATPNLDVVRGWLIDDNVRKLERASKSPGLR